MRRSHSRWPLTLLLLLCWAGGADAAEYWLRAESTSVTMPDGSSVAMWGFAEDLDHDLSTLDGAASVPGPELRLPPGDSQLVIHLRNDLPMPVSFLIQGQPDDAMAPTYSAGRVLSFTHEAAAGGGLADYSWSGLRAGTYLYQSGTHPAVEVQMGLYGALVADASAGFAYPGIAYDQDLVLLYSEIDPVFHQAVSTGGYGPGGSVSSAIDYSPRYFLVNGRPYDAASSTPIELGQTGPRVLLRFLNSGLRSIVPMFDGLYVKVLTEDAHPVPVPPEVYSLPLPAAKTHDALLELSCSTAPRDYALFDRRLNLTNAGQAPGGLLSTLRVLDSDGDLVIDLCDNCIAVANANQRNTNAGVDSFGNICDVDLNDNGTVEFGDIIEFIGAWASSGPGLDADFNGDGFVNLLDLGTFLSNWGSAPGPAGALAQ